MAPINLRRRRTAFTYPTPLISYPLSIRRTARPLILPSLKPHHAAPRCSAAPPDQRAQFHMCMETARRRALHLDSRAIVRVAEASILIAENLLSQPPPANSTVMARLRRDLRRLHRAKDEAGVNEDALLLISKFTSVLAGLERAQLTNDQPFVMETVEDSLEGPMDAENDVVWEDPPPAADSDLVQNVRRVVIEKGNTLKRKASNVGADIEERVSVFIRDDGSVDVDALRSIVGNVLDNAGMTWNRLNGYVPKDGQGKSNGDDASSASLEVRDLEKEFMLREEIGLLEKSLSASSREREAVLRREDQLGKLIRAKEIRQMDDGVSILRRTLAVRVLQLEMEKIYVSLADEIENSDYEMMMEQRVLVVEFGDLDERLATLQLFVDQEEPLLIDDDILGKLAGDVQDLKTRLGLEESLYSSSTLNWTQLQQFWTSSARKTRAGAEFYYRGFRLFIGDLKFTLRLVRRAMGGYTPSPREVRTIRRTGRDLFTLIPFSIVLVLPLTPVGHVLIFSLLQRYWPEFFPSTFSERRQEVMRRHELYKEALQEEGAGDEGKGDGSENGRGGGVFEGVRRFLKLGGGERNEMETEGGGSEDATDGTKVVGTDSKVGNVERVELDNSSSGLKDNGGGKGDGVIDRMGRRKSNGVALDELHLAD